MIAEDVVRLGPMIAMAGLSVAWLAQLSARTRGYGYGFLPDVTLGLVGSLAAGLVVWAALASGAGMLAMFGIGAAGALLTIATQRGVWHAGSIR